MALNLQLQAKRIQGRLSISVIPQVGEELRGKPTQRTDGRHGRGCVCAPVCVCACMYMCVSGLLLERTGKATPEAESGSQRMQITVAHVSTLY